MLNIFTVTHAGIGRVFKGVLKDLKIYSKSADGSGSGGGGYFISNISK